MENSEVIKLHADVFNPLHSTESEKLSDEIYIIKSNSLHGYNWNRGLILGEIRPSKTVAVLKDLLIRVNPSQPCVVVFDNEVEDNVKSYFYSNDYKVKFEGVETWLSFEKSSLLSVVNASADINLYQVVEDKDQEVHFKVFNDLFNPEQYNLKNYKNLKDCDQFILEEFNRKAESVKKSYKKEGVMHFVAQKANIVLGCATLSFADDGKTAGICHMALKDLYRTPEIKGDAEASFRGFVLQTAFKSGVEKVLLKSSDFSINKHRSVGATVEMQGKVLAFSN